MEDKDEPTAKVVRAEQVAAALQAALAYADDDHPALRHIREAATIAALHLEQLRRDITSPPSP